MSILRKFPNDYDILEPILVGKQAYFGFEIQNPQKNHFLYLESFIGWKVTNLKKFSKLFWYP